MALRFYNEHASRHATIIDWRIEIHDSAFEDTETEFDVEAGAEIDYSAASDSIFAPVLGSTCSFTMVVENSTHAALIDDLAGAPEGRFTVVVLKDSVFHWAGVINSPEISIQDKDYPYGFKITAVDGLALLKNYEYRQGGTSATKYSLRYTGIDNLVDIILRCLKKLPHVVEHYASSTKFLVTAVNWYSDLHDATPAGDVYDPLYYTEIDNRFAVTGQSSGNAKYLSCYDVLSAIMTAFGARIALYDGYFLVEQIEHRAYTIDSNDNYSRAYEYDGTGPTANTLTADQDVGGNQTIKKARGNTRSFVPPSKSARVKQNVDSLANLLAGYYFDSGTVEDNTIEDVFGDGVNNHFKFSGTIEWNFDNIGIGAAGTTPFVARFRLKFNLGSKYAERLVTYDGGGNWTTGQMTWENSLTYIEIPVALTIPDVGSTWAGQTPINLTFPAYSGFTLEDLTISLELIEVNYYILGVETLLDPSDYDLDWNLRDPYCATGYNPKKLKTLGLPTGAINPQTTIYEVIGDSQNTEVFEVETMIGDRIGPILNQWGGLLFNDAGDYSYTSTWGARNGSRDYPIAQLLAKRLIEYFYYPKRTYRGSIIGSALSAQVPITDETTTETFLLKSGTYYTQADELTGEWVQLSFTAAELTYAPVEYDTGEYEPTTPGGGGSGSAGSVDNGGNGGGSGGGGNGIYAGSGTTPDGTVVTMAGDFGFSNTAASGGDAWSVTIDDGATGTNVVRVKEGDGILLQSGEDQIQLQGETLLNGVLTTSSLGSDQNDFDVAGANYVRINTSTAINITGFAGGVAGRVVLLHNVSSNPVTLTNADTGSSAGNRADIGENYTIRSKHCAAIQYDGVDSRWRLVSADRLGRFVEAYTTSTATTASLTATSPATNIGLAIAPKGTGALTAAIPDGTATGGNARGNYAVDLQTQRTNATDVASGANSTIPGGRRCTASGTYSFATGYRGVASGSGSVAFGGSGSFSTGATASGTNSFAFGTGAVASATGAIAFGPGTTASYQNGISFGGILDFAGMFQCGTATFLTWYYLPTVDPGTFELFLDGTSQVATLTSGHTWKFEITVYAKTAVVGAGSGTINDIYIATYNGLIRNLGGTTSLIGSIGTVMSPASDSSMSDAAFSITADDTTDYLKIDFTTPSSAGTGSQYNLYAKGAIYAFS